MLKSKIRPFFFSMLSGACLVCAFPNFNITYLAWIGLIPLFFAFEGASPLKAFGLSCLSGFTFFLGTLYWLIHVTLPGMVAFAAFLSLYFGFFGLLCSYFINKKRAFGSFFAIGALWVIFEWLRGNIFGGFPWALLAHSQCQNTAIIQIADFIGAYGVSFIIVCMNSAIYFTIKDLREKRYNTFYLAAAIIIVFLSLYYGVFRMNNIFTGEIFKVGVVQGNIPQDEKWDTDFRGEILDRYDRLTMDAALSKPDLIVWPETSVPGFLLSEKDLLYRITDIAKRSRSALLTGSPREEKLDPDTYYNSAFLFDGSGNLIGTYDKLHLVPFGEYIPFKRVFSFVEKYTKSTIGDFSKGREYTVFNLPLSRHLVNEAYRQRLYKNVRFSALICFEDIFPDLARNFVKNGAVFLVNITNDGWFGPTSASYQHLQCAIFRAVENRVNIIRAANTGLSCFIDQKGRVIKKLSVNGKDIFVEGEVVSDIVLTRTATFYTKYGDIFVYLCFAFVIFYFVKKKFFCYSES